MSTSYKEESKKLWWRDGNPTTEDLKLGCLQRIADSLENMEKPYLKLLNDAEYLSRRHREHLASEKRMARRIAALQGVITKMKKKQKS